jgi:Fe-S-cluster containining protein
MRLSELAEYSLQVCQREAETRALKTELDGFSITCRKGCGACCRQVVPVSPPEAWLIAEMVQTAPEPQKNAVLGRFREAGRVLDNSGMGEASLLSAGAEYFRLGIPCPFLEAEACSIHPHRPTACRDYLVTTPAYRCAEPEGSSISVLPVRVRISECLSDIAGRLLGWGHLMIPLVRALAWAAEHEEEGNRNWDESYLISLLHEKIG